MGKEESVDVCLTIDTTGSMYPCLKEVRRRASETVAKLFRDIKNLRIQIIVHGDYCDARTTYVTKTLSFSRNVDEIQRFINSVESTYGGDAPECYELVLYEAARAEWKAASRALIMIGDDVPHDERYPENTKRINWKSEVEALKMKNVKLYGCHAMPGIRSHSKWFYQQLALLSDGSYLTLDQFSSINLMIMGVCYKQTGNDQLNQFVYEIGKSRRLTKDLAVSFSGMGAKIPADIRDSVLYGGISHKGRYLTPVASGRFQVFAVDTDCSIREFVEGQGISFRPGRGFYELTKSVKVQQYKEIILVHKTTGEIYIGADIREKLGLSPQTTGIGVIERLNGSHVGTFAEYSIFIQSTSYNRKLLGGTKFMYEVEEGTMVTTAPPPEELKKPAVTDVAPKKKKSKKSKPATAPAVTGKKKDIEIETTLKYMVPISSRMLLAHQAYEMRVADNLSFEEIARKLSYSNAASVRKAVKRVDEHVRNHIREHIKNVILKSYK